MKKSEKSEKGKTKKAKRRKKKKIVFTKAKKKRAVARAVIKEGRGRITINKLNIDVLQPKYLVDFIKEPLMFLPQEKLGVVDMNVNVKGGGFMGQAVAARAAIAKGLVEYFGDKKLKDAYLKYDRLLLVDDVRRVEPKKPLGTKARKKKQKSKR
ncbi:MAG: 30S ribosomal protein S9 [Candidatus Iainarchaeum archaeon]|mgnify:CR=1 FL=1|uniref:30S ribosomal protein S9 n=1 Tax=Candidatus Iainarchaeum sp. TaxID=3101447 RepID=A0A497JHE5_9ARCH|nr:MAG: 30S ribosomal protein S9 [Candidatus Diapherotrites archaeon]